MLEPIYWLDHLLQQWMPPVASVAVWAIASSVVSMYLYALLAPQQRLSELKERQKTSRRALMKFDGELDEARALIAENLSVSFRLIGLCLAPVLVATLPIIWIIYGLYGCYSESITIIPFGPAWMRGFDMYYLLVLIVVSVFIKIRFRIV